MNRCTKMRRIAANIGKLPEAFAATLVHALGDPNSPVCGQDEVKLFFGFGVHPAADSTLARKCESVFAVAVINGEFHIALERSGIYWLPVHRIHPSVRYADGSMPQPQTDPFHYANHGQNLDKNIFMICHEIT
jgi:hypothetical protein